MNASDKVFVLGGNLDTRNKLLKEVTRTAEEIQKLLNEASKSVSIEHTFVTIWNILQTRYETGSPNQIRGLILEYYFLGFLNYGCPYVASGGVQIQKFDHTESSNKTFPEFECTIAKEGCHGDKDCHYKHIWCSCYGDSCVSHKTVKLDNDVPKTTAHPNYDTDWGWGGCKWKVAGSYCDCYNTNRDRRERTWPLRIRDAVAHKARSHRGHLEAKDPAQRKPKGKEEPRIFHASSLKGSTYKLKNN